MRPLMMSIKAVESIETAGGANDAGAPRRVPEDQAPRRVPEDQAEDRPYAQLRKRRGGQSYLDFKRW